VNADLLKAERELARGNPDEASVHAWNALATIKPEELGRLLQVAQELDDRLLIHEIEGRSLPIDELEAKAERERLRPVFFLLAFVLVWIAWALQATH